MFVIIDGMTENSAGNKLYNTREKSFVSVVPDRQFMTIMVVMKYVCHETSGLPSVFHYPSL